MTELMLPQNWSSKRLKYLATYNDEVLPESTDKEKEIDYVEISGVSFAHGIEEIERMSFDQAPSRARRKVRSNDILISTVRTYLRAIAKVDEASPDLIASTGFCVVRPNDEVESEFLGWAAKSEPFVSEVVTRSVGVSYPAINASELVTIYMPLPPLDSQRKISWFLDEKIARIDRLIEKKQKLIDRLAEKRQALITRTVSKGLNPDTSLKPSDIGARRDDHRTAESAVDVIAFPTRRLRFACEDPLKYGANAAAQYDDPEWPRFVRITDITESGQLKDNSFRSLPPDIAEDYLLEDGDILLARSGSIGRSFIYKTEWGEACFAGYLIRARLSKEFDPRFVYWSLNTLNYWSWIESIAIRSTIQNVSAERYAEYAVPAPPLDTQRRIAQFLDEKTAQIDGLIDRIWDSVARLEEYRSAQITAAVTGQLTEL